jgi:Ran GTPase-activating protein (RanGAP) involved in mRNA processing and transport
LIRVVLRPLFELIVRKMIRIEFVSKAGEIIHSQQGSSDTKGDEVIIFDLSPLQDHIAIHRFFENCKKIQFIQIQGKRMIPNYPEHPLFIYLFSPSSYIPALEEFSLQNVNLFPNQVHLLCDLFNPTLCRIQWKSLKLCNCGINSWMLSSLCQGFSGNAFLQKLDLSHNELDDESVLSLKQFLLHSDNGLTSLTVNNNHISAKGLALINEILESHRNQLKYLSLSNNPLSSSEQLSNTFASLTLPFHQLTTLHLSSCRIQDCNWSQFLPFMNCLSSLSLSNNFIDDSNLVKLFVNLIHCFALVELNLSQNRFGQEPRTASFWKEMLKGNQSLQLLDISFNRLHPTLWKAISEGLASSKVLLLLNCEQCLVGETELLTLASPGFLENDIVDCRLDFNPLPPEAIQNCRSFCLTHKQQQQQQKTKNKIPTTTTSNETNSNNNVLPLNPLRQKLSTEFAKNWRRKKFEEITVSLSSLAIVSEEQQQELKEGQKEDSTTILGREKGANGGEDHYWNLETIRKSEFFKTVEEMESLLSLDEQNDLKIRL